MVDRERLALLLVMGMLTLAQTYFMLTTFAFLTGWRRLARTHPHRDAKLATPPLHATQGVLLDAWGWNAPPMRLGHDGEGIVLRPLVFFRLIFPSVKVPWSALVAIERKTNLYGEMLVVHYGPDGRNSLAFLPSALSGMLAEISQAHELRMQGLTTQLPLGDPDKDDAGVQSYQPRELSADCASMAVRE